MARRTVTFDLQECYHIYNRGNDKQPIFMEPENYRFFLKQTLKYLPVNRVDLLAYCLMPNHYHLLIRLNGSFDFSQLMKNFTISFVKAMNTRYQKVGHLFQGEFKAKHVDSTEYLLHLSRYIHMNPVFAKLVNAPDKWEFSSYREYIRAGSKHIVQTGFILSHFDNPRDYSTYVETLSDTEFEKITKSF